ncbi:MAG: DUF1189 domain-containing protein [Vallitalea sp.]|jgi:hypothetical protein|nr:DUF1189 domain-containing protein [Vallitalea sp.]
MENENPNIFMKFIKSFTDFNIYSKIRYEKLSKSFGYLIIFSLILGIIFASYISIKTNDSINKTIAFLEEDNIPNITIKNGLLNVDIDEPLILTNQNDFIFILDMSGEHNLNDLIGYTLGYLVTPERIIINQAGTPSMPIEFKNIRNIDLDKDTIIKYLNGIRNILIIIIFIVILIVVILFKLLESLLVSIIALIINSTSNTNLTYTELYKISIYALTLPSIISFVFILIGIGMPFIIMLLLYYGISTYIIILALKNISQNTNNSIDNNF